MSVSYLDINWHLHKSLFSFSGNWIFVCCNFVTARYFMLLRKFNIHFDMRSLFCNWTRLFWSIILICSIKGHSFMMSTKNVKNSNPSRHFLISTNIRFWSDHPLSFPTWKAMFRNFPLKFRPWDQYNYTITFYFDKAHNTFKSHNCSKTGRKECTRYLTLLLWKAFVPHVSSSKN